MAPPLLPTGQLPFLSERTARNAEKRARKFGLMCILFLALAGFQYASTQWRSGANSSPAAAAAASFASPLSRTLLQSADPYVGPIAGNTTIKIGNFPADAFSYSELRAGAVLLHILCSLVLFLGLSIVSDEYLEPGLALLSHRMGLKEDVAGATIMALGGSAPELFVMFYSVFLSRSDIGLGTIFGSAGVNQLGLLALIAFSTEPVDLTPFPIARDCFSYCAGVLVLLIVLSHGEPSSYPGASAVVHWYMAVGMLGAYALYLILLAYNDSVHRLVNARIRSCAESGGPTWPLSRWLRRNVLSGTFGYVWDFAIYAVILLNISVVLFNVSQSPSGGLKDDLEAVDTMCKVVFGFEMLVKLVALDPVCYWTDPFNSFDGFLVFLIIVEAILSSSVAAGVRAVRLFRLFRGLRGLRGARLFKACFGAEDREGDGFECEVVFDENGVQMLDEDGNKLLARDGQGRIILLLDEDGQPRKKDHLAAAEAVIEAAALRVTAARVADRGVLGSTRGAGGLLGGAGPRRGSFLSGAGPLAPGPRRGSLTGGGASSKAGGSRPGPNWKDPSAVAAEDLDGGVGRTHTATSTVGAGGKSVQASSSDIHVLDASPSAPIEDAYSPFAPPRGVLAKVVWAVSLPLAVAMWATIPSVRRGGRFQRGDGSNVMLLLTLLVALVWVGAMCFVLLWVTLTIGVTLGIRENVMGLTWLAWGTSVTDWSATLAAAKRGRGDGAVSSAIGSNVFNVVFAIPFAWLWYGIVFDHSGSIGVVTILSHNLILSLMVILITMALSLICIHFGSWRLTPVVGAACLFLYVIFLVFVVLLESDVLG